MTDTELVREIKEAAVEPVERTSIWEEGKLPETYRIQSLASSKSDSCS